MAREATVARKTQETEINVELSLDGQGQALITTTIGFFDHMLELLCRFSLFDITISATGDTEVDYHHTVEDVGICLGQALDKALGDRSGIRRFSTKSAPMDECLATACIDISGRPLLVFNVEFKTEKTGEFDVALAEEFFRALVTHAKITLHLTVPYGKNAHHICEALFKATGLALREATDIDPRSLGVPSTKGTLS